MISKMFGWWQDRERKVFDLPINWAWMAAFAVFWTYGYYGAVSFKGLPLAWNMFITLAFAGLLVLFLYCGHACRNVYADRLTVTRRDMFALAAFFLILFPISFPFLRQPLVDDQIFHAQEAHRQAMTAVAVLSSKMAVLDQMPYAAVLYAVGLCLIGVIAGVSISLRKRSFVLTAALITGLFVVLRTIIVLRGCSGAPHPPFRLFPLWLSSSVFSSADITFKLPQFLGLIVFMALVQRLVRRRMPAIHAWCFALAAGTFPLLWHVGCLAEFSLWTGALWSLFLLLILAQDGLKDIEWVRWCALICIFTLVRQSSFVALVPFILVYLFVHFRQRPVDIRKAGMVFLPVLVMLPFVAKSFVIGTPSTYIPGEASFIPNAGSALARVWYATSNGILSWALANSLFLPWAVLPIASIAWGWRSRTEAFKAAVVIVFFAVAVYIFYSIRPGLWGYDRYQAEYAVPFAIAGLFVLAVSLSRMGRLASAAVLAGLIGLCVYNVVVFTQYSAKISSQVAYQGRLVGSETYYDLGAAFRAVKDEGLAGHEYYVGVTYGVFPEVLNGFTVAEVAASKRIFERQNELKAARKISWTNADPALVDEDPEISLVLAQDSECAELIHDLEARGWRHWKDFTHALSGKVIYGMRRGTNQKGK